MLFLINYLIADRTDKKNYILTIKILYPAIKNKNYSLETQKIYQSDGKAVFAVMDQIAGLHYLFLSGIIKFDPIHKTEAVNTLKRLYTTKQAITTAAIGLHELAFGDVNRNTNTIKKEVELYTGISVPF